jgi:tyrosinase
MIIEEVSQNNLSHVGAETEDSLLRNRKANPFVDENPKTIIFIDSQLQIPASYFETEEQNARVYLLNSSEDGISQISQVLAQYEEIKSVQIFSHGSSAALQLGASRLSVETLPSHRQELSNWSNSLTAEADILCFGCNLAAGVNGQGFVNELATITGADIAASTNLTGSGNLGGDWNLEYQTGSIETNPAVPGILVGQQDILLYTFDRSSYTAASVLDFTKFGYTYDKDTNSADGNRFATLPSNAAQRTGLEVRKNAANLTQAEINAFVNAVKTLKSTKVVTDNGITTNVYDQFVATHTSMRDAQGRIGPDGNVLRNPGHSGSAFLPWHRTFLNEFEEALQKVNPNVTIPYWDWTDQTSSLNKLFVNSFLGPNGTASSASEVLSGPFSRAQGWRLREDLTGSRWNGLSTTTVGLTRQFGGATGTTSLGTTANVAFALRSNDYLTFRDRLESGAGLHDIAHRWIGGTMGNVVASANDPVFWMLHANVDRIWAEWQLNNHWGNSFYPASGQPYGHNLNDLFFPWDRGAIKIAADLKDLLPNIPKTVDITRITDNVGSSTGMVPRGGSTDDQAPVLSGSLSNPLEAGEVLVVFRNGIRRGTATVNAESWSYSDTGLTAGTTYSYTARVIESASANFSGNQGPLSSAYKITIQPVNSSSSPQFKLMTGEGSSAKPLVIGHDAEENTSLSHQTKLNQAGIDSVIDDALQYWAVQGLGTQNLQRLENTKILVEDLGGSVLGTADPQRNVIRIDDDAAGQGWSISFDALTPSKVDLLSILAHEIGHILGYDHSVMGESLGPGERRLPLDFNNTHHPNQLFKTPTYPKALVGVAEISTDLINSGVVSPGNSIGRMRVKGDYQQLADSTLTIEIAGCGQGQLDVLEISGQAAIAGKLNLYFLDDFEPQAGDSFVFLKSSAIHGKFDQINVFGLNYGYDFELEEQDGKYILRVLGPKGSCQIENSEQTNQDCSSRYRFSSHGFASTRAELTADRQGAVYNPAFGEDLLTGHYLYQFHGGHDGHQTVDANFFVPITQQEPEMLASVLRGEAPPEWAIAQPMPESQPPDKKHDHSNPDLSDGSQNSLKGGPVHGSADHRHDSVAGLASGVHRHSLGRDSIGFSPDFGGHNHDLSENLEDVDHTGHHQNLAINSTDHSHQIGAAAAASALGRSHSSHQHSDTEDAHDHSHGSDAVGLGTDYGFDSHTHSTESGESSHNDAGPNSIAQHSHDSHLESHSTRQRLVSLGDSELPITISHSSHARIHSNRIMNSGHGLALDAPILELIHLQKSGKTEHRLGFHSTAEIPLERIQPGDPHASLHTDDDPAEDLSNLLDELLLKTLLIALTISQTTRENIKPSWDQNSTSSSSIRPHVFRMRQLLRQLFVAFKYLR